MKHAQVIVTAHKMADAYLIPYSHAGGLQRYVVNGDDSDQAVFYVAPSYAVKIVHGSRYSALRFGLQNKGTFDEVRQCDAGLTKHHVCKPTWVPGYSPHSFAGTGRKGAFKLFPDRHFLIHEGAADISHGGGTLGCIEILEGRWNAFLTELERICGVGAPEIGENQLLTVTIEAAHPPRAIRLD